MSRKTVSACGWGSSREREWNRFVSEHPTNLEFYGMLFLIVGLFAFACLVIR